MHLKWQERTWMQVRTAVLIALAAALVWQALLLASTQINDLDSDHLWGAQYIQEVLFGSVPGGDWHLPPANSLFPDIAVLAPLLWIGTGAVGPAFWVYGVLSFLVLWGLQALIVRRAAPKAAWSLVALGLAWLAYAALSLKFDVIFNAVVPTFHGGILLIGFFLVWLALGAVERGWRWWEAAAFFLAAMLGSLSDNLIAAQFFLPIALAAALTIKWNKRYLLRTFLPLVAMLGVAVGVALLIKEHLLAGVIMAPPVKLTTYAGNHPRGEVWGLFVRDYLTTFPKQQPILAFLFNITPLVAAAAWIVSVWRRKRGDEATRDHARMRRFLWLFILISFVGSLAGPVAVALWHDFGSFRYLYTVWVFPPLCLALVTALGRPRLQTAVLALLAVAVVVTLPLWSDLPLHIKTPYPAEIRCLDDALEARDIRRGFGDYWNTRRVNFLNQSGLRVYPGTSDMGLRSWISSTRPWCDLLKPEPFFVLPRGLDAGRLKSRLGPPRETVRCVNEDIWIYNGDDDPAMGVDLLRPALRFCGKP